MLDKRPDPAQDLDRALHTEGQPVGSHPFEVLRLDLSPATIRNVMSDLEDMGFIANPHTSAGRVPTPLGYRFFVDTLLIVKQLETGEPPARGRAPSRQPAARGAAASHLLSQLTQFAGVVMTPRRRSIAFRHIEFLRLSEKRILLIVVTPRATCRTDPLHRARVRPGELVGRPTT